LNGGAHSRPIQDLRGRYPEATVVEDEDQMGGLLARVADLIEHPEQERLPIDMRGSDFELRVWTALRDVPAGTTVTYGDIAARIGAPKEAREVGEACAANVLAVVVPCHRVVRRDGLISGYRWGVKRKRDLLDREAFGCELDPFDSRRRARPTDRTCHGDDARIRRAPWHLASDRTLSYGPRERVTIS
jgi:AraC family transcriptional regulator, regulatory protein of adaptative response / methylated-DNA-[protein]-cysteine methyltransferase